MNYCEALSFLNQLGSFATASHRTQRMAGFELEPYRDFLSKIGNPQNGLKYIHVAGSKGKGSTCTYMAEILKESGYKVGLYTSPYLQVVLEQFWINGELITENDFADLVFLVKEKMESVEAKLSYFEFITTMVFYYFQRMKVDYVVLEVGLGGLKDATNVVEPVLTVLTQIELEHTDVLGSTIEEVASNKLGILKKDTPMVVAWQKYDLKSQVTLAAKTSKSPVVFMQEQGDIGNVQIRAEGTSFEFDRQKWSIKMVGVQFAKSFLTAVYALRLLGDGVATKEVALKVGNTLLLPWRFEVCTAPGGVQVVLDMAHTVEGMKYLKDSLDKVFNDKKRIFLIAALGDKDVKEMFNALIDPQDIVYVTSTTNPRAWGAEDLAQKINLKDNVVFIEQNNKDALIQALKRTKQTDVLVLTGSHYLLADLVFAVQSW